jgi:hypothetical protein
MPNGSNKLTCKVLFGGSFRAKDCESSFGAWKSVQQFLQRPGWGACNWKELFSHWPTVLISFSLQRVPSFQVLG